MNDENAGCVWVSFLMTVFVEGSAKKHYLSLLAIGPMPRYADG